MSNIGKINKRNLEGRETLDGYVSTLHFNLKFELRPNKQKQSDNAPDYQIMAKNGFGDETSVGAVWIKTMGGFGDEPKQFFSMTFDDPSFEHSLNVAAFQADDTTWDIVWRRRQSIKEAV